MATYGARLVWDFHAHVRIDLTREDRRLWPKLVSVNHMILAFLISLAYLHRISISIMGFRGFDIVLEEVRFNR
jgi:hypothetical protein